MAVCFGEYITCFHPFCCGWTCRLLPVWRYREQFIKTVFILQLLQCTVWDLRLLSPALGGQERWTFLPLAACVTWAHLRLHCKWRISVQVA